MNVQFNYLYRDASNYKKWGEVVFANPDKLSLTEVEERLRKVFDSEELFIADQIHIAELFFDEITEDDHCYHEFNSVETTETEPDDPMGRTVKMFIEEVEQEARRGWEVFEPMDREVNFIKIDLS